MTIKKLKFPNISRFSKTVRTLLYVCVICFCMCYITLPNQKSFKKFTVWIYRQILKRL